MRGKKNSVQNSIIANSTGAVDLIQQKKGKKRNHFLIIFPILIFIIFSGICFGGYYYYENYMIESTQSIYMNYMHQINLNNVFDGVLYSKLATKNNSIVHNTNAKLSVKSKNNQEDDESVINKLIYDFDIFSNPQSNEKYVELGINYGDNNLVKLEGVEKDKYMAVSCSDILDEYITWEKENTAYYMSKISNTRSKFDYNKVFELFNYQNVDFKSNEKNELFWKMLKVVSKNTKKSNYEEKTNVSLTDENGDYLEATGYKLSLNKDERNKVIFEIVKSIKEDDELIKKITIDDNDSSSVDINSSNLIYKIIESIILEKKIGISPSKLKSLLDAKMIEIENNSKQESITVSIYIVDEKIKFLIADDGQEYIKCEALADSSIKITYLTKDMPQYINGTIDEVVSNINEGMVFIDKALDGEYVVPEEPEDDEIQEDNPQIQPGSLKSIKIVGNNQSQDENNVTDDQSTTNAQNVDNSVNTSEQSNNNSNPSNPNPSTPNPNPSTVDVVTGETIRIGEQGEVTIRNAPQIVEVAVEENKILSREDIIEDSNVGEVDFSSNDSDESATLRDEEHDIDNSVTDLENNLTDTSLYTSGGSEFEANSTQSNGFSLIIKKDNTGNELSLEYDEIKNSQISSKYIIQMSIDGNADSTEVKNDVTVNYYDNSCQKLINLKYSTKYGENTTEVPDIQSGSLILDELGEEEFDNGIAQIRGFILKYIKLKKNQWDLITKNG